MSPAAAGEPGATRRKKRKNVVQPEPSKPPTPPPLPSRQNPSPILALEAPVLGAYPAAGTKERKRKRPKEEKMAAAPPPAQNPNLDLEEHGEAAVARKRRNKFKREKNAPPSAAAELPILDQGTAAAAAPAQNLSLDLEEHGEAAVARKRRNNFKREKYAPQSAAAELPILDQKTAAAAPPAQNPSLEVAARRRSTRRGKVHVEGGSDSARTSKEHPPAPYPVLEEAVMAVMPKKKKKRKQLFSPPLPAAAEAPMLEQMAVAAQNPVLDGEAVQVRRRRKRKRNEHAEVEVAPSQSPDASATFQAPIVESEQPAAPLPVMPKKRTRSRKINLPPPAAAAETLNLEQGGTKTKKRGKSPAQAHSVQPQGTRAPPQEEAHGPKCTHVRKTSNRKKLRVPSNREIIRRAIELRKNRPLPEGFVAFADCTENPDNSSLGTFFNQFCYKPIRQERNPPPPPTTPIRQGRPPSRGRQSSESPQLAANRTSEDNASAASKTKKPSSTSNSQRNANVEGRKKPEKKPRKPAPSLTKAEKCSEKYRRLSSDKLVAPPLSPFNLLQEKYAPDPWKVIVVCMLLNLTQGQQVWGIEDVFFTRYPDAQMAIEADPKEMARYLAPLGLQHVKTRNIQKFSKAYVGEEWNYVTELCGVGKYAADAYAIFCAGRAIEVIPFDHMLEHYWRWVCDLPVIEEPVITQRNVKGS